MLSGENGLPARGRLRGKRRRIGIGSGWCRTRYARTACHNIGQSVRGLLRVQRALGLLVRRQDHTACCSVCEYLAAMFPVEQERQHH